MTVFIMWAASFLMLVSIVPAVSFIINKMKGVTTENQEQNLFALKLFIGSIIVFAFTMQVQKQAALEECIARGVATYEVESCIERLIEENSQWLSERGGY